MTIPVNEILIGDALEHLKKLPDSSVHCCVTSPPYWGLRDYGVSGQVGLEATPEEYVSRMVQVFREVRRTLRDDGTLWLNLGDCYATGAGKVGDCPGGGEQGARWRGSNDPGGEDKRGSHTPIPKQNTRATRDGRHVGKNTAMVALGPMTQPNRMPIPGLKPKDLIGIPWRMAFALQADGWYLRLDIIWSKPNPMPEPVKDRPTKAHEYVFLMSKSERYYYDTDAVKEPSAGSTNSGNKIRKKATERGCPEDRVAGSVPWEGSTRNKRSVWTVASNPFSGAHFAVFPEKLIEPCIMAGCPKGGIVLDPFMGAGTTALVALKAARKFIGIELNPEYAKIAEHRIWGEKNQARIF